MSMKKSLFFLLLSFALSGCYSSVGVGSAAPLGKHGVIGSTVSVGSDGRVHGNVGVGTAIRL
jgi:UDP-3-O-[3-hydroxymyristoyl] glucosamine N-acyltransferase